MKFETKKSNARIMVYKVGVGFNKRNVLISEVPDKPGFAKNVFEIIFYAASKVPGTIALLPEMK